MCWLFKTTQSFMPFVEVIKVWRGEKINGFCPNASSTGQLVKWSYKCTILGVAEFWWNLFHLISISILPFSYFMPFMFILFIDTAGVKHVVNKQYLSIANYTIFQMIMGTPESILGLLIAKTIKQFPSFHLFISKYKQHFPSRAFGVIKTQKTWKNMLF